MAARSTSRISITASITATAETRIASSKLIRGRLDAITLRKPVIANVDRAIR